MKNLSHCKRNLVIGVSWLFGLPTLLFCVFLLLETKIFLRDWLFPPDVILYVLDERAKANFLEDFEGVYADSTAQPHSSKKMLVHRVAKGDVIHSFGDLLDRYGETLDAPWSGKLYFLMQPPMAESMKALRHEISQQKRFVDSDGRNLKGRLVVLLAADSKVAQKTCDSLDEHWAYARWNFGGIGLVIDDATADLIKFCLPGLIERNLEM